MSDSIVEHPELLHRAPQGGAAPGNATTICTTSCDSSDKWGDDASEPNSSLGTRSFQDGKTSSVAQSSPATLTAAHGAPVTAEMRTPDVGSSSNAAITDALEDQQVTIKLNTGEDLTAEAYGHSVSGHHVMLKQEGRIWKATRSHREERFYVTMTHCNRRDPNHVCENSGGISVARERESDGNRGSCDDPDTLLEEEQSLRAAKERNFLGACTPDEVVCESARLLKPFVPKFYGMRQVQKLRCATDKQTPGTEVCCATVGGPEFPRSPTNTAPEVRFDAAAKLSAEQLVASFQAAAAATTSIPSLGTSPQATGDPFEAIPALVTGYPPAAAAVAAPAAPQLPGAVTVTTTTTTGTNPALRRTTILPSKAPEEGRPLDHRLPRTANQMVDMIVLEDVCHNFHRPCVLDIKMGTRQYGVNAPETKRLSKSAKAKRSTSSTLGIRVSGYKLWNEATQSYEAKGKHECFELTALQVEETVTLFCGNNPSLIQVFLRIVRQFEEAFQRQKSFRFYTSSVLLVYDAAMAERTARLVMVDFAYTYCRSELVAANDENADDLLDTGYLRGVESLVCILERSLRRTLVTT